MSRYTAAGLIHKRVELKEHTGAHQHSADPEMSDGVMCVGPDGVHACGGHGHGTEDGICMHADGTEHPCGDCPNCRMTVTELTLVIPAR